MKKYLLLLLIAACTAMGYAQADNKGFIVQESFENTNFISSWHHQEGCCNYSVQRTKEVSKTGKYSLKFDLNASDSLVFKGKRAEISGNHEKTAQIERWYTFSIYLPKGYKVDSVPEILAQWHEIADFDKGEKDRSPPISLQIDKERWKLELLWSAKEVNTNKNVDGRENIFLDNFVTGKWNTFVFHIKFSYQDNGLLEVWHNGVLKVTRTGPNYYNDASGPFFKFGIYKPWWINPVNKSVIKNRLLYFDDVRVMNEHGSYQEITKKN